MKPSRADKERKGEKMLMLTLEQPSLPDIVSGEGELDEKQNIGLTVCR